VDALEEELESEEVLAAGATAEAEEAASPTVGSNIPA